jgi:UDP:flavonoid glycosyltransferase YjiC (YdhE family)
MGRFLVVATAGAGGDLQPLIGAAIGLRDRGHETAFLGDESVRRSLRGIGLESKLLPRELDLGPRLVEAIRDAMETAHGDAERAGPIVVDRMSQWAREASDPVAEEVRSMGPDAIVTSLFGVEILDRVSPPYPWAVVNSTFYVGPNPPRPFEKDFAPRAIPLIRAYAGLLGSASLVLHATDKVFDLGFEGLPPRHHYAGPLGVWEPPSDPDPWLDEPGDPWVLVSLSSQLQDDLPLAEAALAALSDRPLRVLLTVGPDRDPDELLPMPGNARAERTVSHSAVLQRGALLVSHAGHGAVMKSLWHGRPMVLIPWGRDQPGVAARAKALGVAEVVPREGLSSAILSNAVDRVLADDAMHERAAQHAYRLLATDPPSVAASLLEALLQEKESIGS